MKTELVLQLLAYPVVIAGVGAAILKVLWGGLTSDEGKSGTASDKFLSKCPHCGQDVTITNEKMKGLWKTCPSCHTQFKVQHLQRVGTESTGASGGDFTKKMIFAICVALTTAVAIILSGNGSAFLLADFAVAAAFVFHAAGLDKADARHTRYLKFARSTYFIAYLFAVSVAFLFYGTSAARTAGVCLIFLLAAVSTYGFQAGRYGAHSACYALFWSWIVFFGVRAYNPHLLIPAEGLPQVVEEDQEPHSITEQAMVPVIRVAGQPVTPSLQHQSAVRHAAFSPDGRRVVTASEDKTAQVWDATTGQPLLPALEHRFGLTRAVFSPDGRLIATASGQFAKGEARLWNSQTGELVGLPLEHNGLVNHVAFSPDGRYIVTASEDRTARIWDVTTGQAITPPLTHEDNVYSAAFSPDGLQVLTAGHDAARIWDVATAQPHSRLLTASVHHAAFHPNGDRVITAGWMAQVWNVQTSERVTAEMRHEYAVLYAEFSHDGRRIVTASGSGGQGEARVWNAATGLPITPPIRHKGNVAHAAFSPDGKFVVTASFDNTAIVWNAETGESSIPPMQHRDGVYYAAFSPDGERVVTASHDKTARVWYVAQRTPTDDSKSNQIAVKAQTPTENDEADLELLLLNELPKSTDAIPQSRELVLRLLAPLSPAEARQRARGSSCPRALMLPLLPRLGLTIDESRRHVRQLLHDGDERVAMAAPEVLVKLSEGQEDVSEDLTAMMKAKHSGSVEFKEAVRKALNELAQRDQPHVVAALKSDDVEIRTSAGEVLQSLGAMQKLDLSELLKYSEDERAAPMILVAVLPLKPFPKEGLALLLSGLRAKPELAGAIGEILKNTSAEDLKALVPDLTKLVDHQDLNVHRAALDGLASAGAIAVPYLAERARQARAENDRDFIFALTLQRACSLVTSRDKTLIPFLVQSAADDDESKAAQAVADTAVGALVRLGKMESAVLSASDLVDSFAAKSDDSHGARRLQRILASMGDGSLKELIRGTESKDESICTWSLRTIPLVAEFYSNQFVINEARQFAALTFESRSERVRVAGSGLLHQFPNFRLPQSALPVIKKYVASNDTQKKSWAVTLSARVATGPIKSPAKNKN